MAEFDKERRSVRTFQKVVASTSWAVRGSCVERNWTQSISRPTQERATLEDSLSMQFQSLWKKVERNGTLLVVIL